VTGGVIVAGTITRDFVESRVGGLDGELGGSAVYSALAARLLGPVGVVAAVTADVESEVRQLLNFADLEAATMSPGTAPEWHAQRDEPGGEAVTVQKFESIPAGYVPAVERVREWPRVVFLGSVDPAVQLAVARAAPADTWIAADTMDVMVSERRHEVEQVLAACRIAFVTEIELELLTHTRGVAAGAERAMDGFGLSAIVVKRGRAGALLWTRGSGTRMPAAAVDVVDPTGAGDALAGGFLGRLAQVGRLDAATLRECLGYGLVMATFAIEGIGVRGLVAATEAEVRTRLEHLRIPIS